MIAINVSMLVVGAVGGAMASAAIHFARLAVDTLHRRRQRRLDAISAAEERARDAIHERAERARENESRCLDRLAMAIRDSVTMTTALNSMLMDLAAPDGVWHGRYDGSRLEKTRQNIVEATRLWLDAHASMGSAASALDDNAHQKSIQEVEWPKCCQGVATAMSATNGLTGVLDVFVLQHQTCPSRSDAGEWHTANAAQIEIMRFAATWSHFFKWYAASLGEIGAGISALLQDVNNDRHELRLYPAALCALLMARPEGMTGDRLAEECRALLYASPATGDHRTLSASTWYALRARSLERRWNR